MDIPVIDKDGKLDTQKMNDEEFLKLKRRSLKSAFPWLSEKELEKRVREDLALFKEAQRQEQKIETQSRQLQRKANTNTLTQKTETKTTSTSKEEQHIYEKIHTWAVRLSNEEEYSKIRYHVGVNWVGLGTRLRQTQGNLIKVVGKQGIGKTAFCNWLRFYLGQIDEKNVRKKRIQKGFEPFGHYEKIHIHEETGEYRNKGIIKEPIKRWVTEKEWEWELSRDLKNLLVDLWDYSKRSQGDIIKALDAIQDYWIYRCNLHNEYRLTERGHLTTQKTGLGCKEIPLPNIVVFLQKEALPLHFFLGKMQLFELKPYAPKTLSGYFEHTFNSSKPFTKEALLEIARLSGGVFRKFKEYIATCMDPYFTSGSFEEMEIAFEDVKRFITSEKIAGDMELTLSELYPRSKKLRILSVKVLRFLREKGPVFQEVINEKFFPNDLMGCSRLLNTLETFGHVVSLKEGRKRRWSIA